MTALISEKYIGLTENYRVRERGREHARGEAKLRIVCAGELSRETPFFIAVYCILHRRAEKSFQQWLCCCCC